MDMGSLLAAEVQGFDGVIKNSGSVYVRGVFKKLIKILPIFIVIFMGEVYGRREKTEKEEKTSSFLVCN